MNNNIEQSTPTYIYSSGNRLDMNNYEINQALRIKKNLEGIYKKLPTIQFSDLKVGQQVGLAYSNNNAQYYSNVKIVAVNPKSVRIQEGDRVWSVNKSTIKNRIFDFKEFYHLCEELETLERAIDSYVSGKISEFWKERIAAAEEQQKREGVYVKSETFLLDHTYPGILRKVSTNREISV